MSKLKRLEAKVGTINTTATRASPSQRIRGGQWQRTRAKVMVRDKGLCQGCLPDKVTPATEVDHKVPLHLGGGNQLSNLQALCRECHAAKSEGEEKARA